MALRTFRYPRVSFRILYGQIRACGSLIPIAFRKIVVHSAIFVMMSDFQLFIDSVQHVPAEFERNIELLRALDTRVLESIKSVNDLYAQYKQTNSKSRRNEIMKQIEDLDKKMVSLGSDKLKIAEQTYHVIDGSVNDLLKLAPTTAEDDQDRYLGYDMPVDPDEPLYCNCRSVSYGEMIACDNKDCPIEWFHLPCVRLAQAPGGKWYCEHCRIRVRINRLNDSKTKKPTPGSRKTKRRRI